METSSPYTSEENLLIQNTLNAVFLASLCLDGDHFMESEYFKNMPFLFPKVKEMYVRKQTGIGNLGMLCACLYSLLVLPKEKDLPRIYSTKYEEVNQWIKDNGELLEDTYKAPHEYIRHLRNTISHGRLEYEETDSEKYCLFQDENKATGQAFRLKMEIGKVGELVKVLIEAQEEFFDELAKKA